MSKQINIEWFREREAQELVTCRVHPTEKLLIWNYTPQCQFLRVWDEVTIQARGLITRTDGTIVARPFKKFFNLEEHQDALPQEPFTVTAKMDGSLGILYFVDGIPFIATRGSFTSEQAQRATKILHERYHDAFPLLRQMQDYTCLFEVIYKENRIVVDYGETEDLILLAAIHTETEDEYDIHAASWREICPFPLVKRYDGIRDLARLRQIEEANAEGFVIRFLSGLRLKLKFAEYVRLHRILTQCTARTIWEILRTNQSFDALLARVPDEFYAWVNITKEALQTQFLNIELFAQSIVSQVHDLPTRKEQASVILQHAYSGVVFCMLDNKPYADTIWKLIKPPAERPFREEREG